MKALRLLAYVLFALALAGAAVGVESLWTDRDLPVETVDARYSNDASPFMHIDGVRLHIRDEGTGPVMLLIHSEFSSLIDWDPWVHAFSRDFRIVRFDLPAHGLTGPDPTGDYHIERTVYLIRRLVEALELDRIVLVGAGAGGAVAAYYAAHHPEEVDRLILLSPDGLTTDTLARLRDPEPAALRIAPYIMPRTVVRLILVSAWGNAPGPDDELVTRWQALWLRAGQRNAQLDWLDQYRPSTAGAAIREVAAPVLLLWGSADAWNRPPRPDELETLLGDRDWRMIVYPGTGHLLVQEAGRRLIDDVGAWLGIESLEAPDVTPEAASP